jgi:hypothetical protein
MYVREEVKITPVDKKTKKKEKIALVISHGSLIILRLFQDLFKG